MILIVWAADALCRCGTVQEQRMSAFVTHMRAYVTSKVAPHAFPIRNFSIDILYYCRNLGFSARGYFDISRTSQKRSLFDTSTSHPFLSSKTPHCPVHVPTIHSSRTYYSCHISIITTATSEPDSSTESHESKFQLHSPPWNI
jgi:hypothetical protein